MPRSESARRSGVDVINAANEHLIAVTRSPVPNVTLSVADSLWVNSRRAQLRLDYAKQMQVAYDAAISLLDFSRPGVVTRINDWASQGQWIHKFDPAQTRQRDFTLAGGKVKQVPRMTQTGRFDYVETPEMQGIRLSFGAGDLMMYAVLPSSSSSLSALEAQLTAENWAAWQARYTSRAGTIELARFELKSNYRLNEALQRLGMVRAFQPEGAQLTGTFTPEAGHSPTAGFLISSVLQSTYWKVEKEGAEAAVTTIGARASAVIRPVPPFQMIVTSPFSVPSRFDGPMYSTFGKNNHAVKIV